MNITEVTVKVLEGKPKIRGVAFLVFDGAFKVRDIAIIERSGGDLYIQMPSKKVDNGKYISYAYPITKEARAEIEDLILAKYHEMKSGGAGEEENEETIDEE